MTLKDQMGPVDPSELYKDVELTEQEVQEALMEARRKKSASIKLAEYKAKTYAKIEYIKPSAENLMESLKKLPGFEIDAHNEEIAWNMCLYFSEDVRSPYAKNKGLLMYGPVGCGKTTLMNFFCRNQVCGYIVVPAFRVAAEFSKDGADAINRYKYLIKCNNPESNYGQNQLGVCFDDVGTEVDKKHYGNESNVMAEIILNRYHAHRDLAGKTHITTNLNTTELEQRYGYRVRSRLREMFNVVTFDDGCPDRRK